jgi:hypothetical protein
MRLSGLFWRKFGSPGLGNTKGTQISMGSSPDSRWVPKLTPQRDRLYRFFTKSVGALYAGLLVLL